MSTKHRAAAFVGTEVLSPFVLAAAMLIMVPAMLAQDWWWQSAIAVLTVVVIPLGLSLWMTRTGRTTDKFIYHRRQRHAYYGLCLVSIGAGTAALLILPSAAATKSLILITLGTVLVIALITLKIKASAHACLSAIFGVILIGLFGAPFVLVSLIIHALVVWSRWWLKKHTIPELIIGSLVGAGAGLLFLALN